MQRGLEVVPQMRDDSPDLVIAMQLLDHLKLCGFEFRRGSPGEDGPLVGHRISCEWVDLVHIEGFSRDCFAWRKRTSSLIVSEEALVQCRVEGSAVDVLNEVLDWEQVTAHSGSYAMIVRRRDG